MTEQTHTQASLMCDLAAIDPEHRASHQTLAEYLLMEAAHETRELPDGYAFRFLAERYPEVAAFIANERLCCPFFAFTLEVTPDRGPIWLHITGREGVKAVLQAALGC